MIEGPDLIEAALAAGVEFEAIYFDGAMIGVSSIDSLVSRATVQGVRVFPLAPGVLQKIADTQTPQPILASVRVSLRALEELPLQGLILVLHEIRDPGNAGTIIRSADAAGAAGIVFTGQSVDPFNPKTLRATAGSIFHLPVVVGTLESVLDHFSRAGVRTLASVVRGGTSHREIDFRASNVVVIGNESDGLKPEEVALCDERLTIVMSGRNESLNAGVAASLFAFEAMWQRQDITRRSPGPSLEEP